MQPMKWKVETRTVSLSLKRLTPINIIMNSTAMPMMVRVLAARKEVLPPTYKLSVDEAKAG